MTPEIGKFYRAADGRKVGPVAKSDDLEWPLEAALDGDIPNNRAYYRANGTCPYFPEYNIEEEWSE